MDIRANLIGSNVRRLRKKRGLTIDQLALMTMLSPKSISFIERGKVQARRSNLEQIAKVLKCSVEDFYIHGRRSSLLDAVKDAAKEAFSERDFRGFTLGSGKRVSLDEIYETLRGMSQTSRDLAILGLPIPGLSSEDIPGVSVASAVKPRPRSKGRR